MSTLLAPLHLCGRLRTSFATLAVVAGGFFGLAVDQAFAGRVISNGTVALGVNDTAQLNFDDGFRFVGVTYEANGNDGTRAGCECEGWGAGVARPSGNFSGSANNFFGGPSNLDLVSFVSTPSTATSIVTIDDQLRVTHAFAPSPSTPNLYEIKVTLENIGATALPDVRYTRLMDWDVEPTEFDEFVTIQGADPQPDALIHSNDNGFANSDPFADHSPDDPTTENADYTDRGPADHGALFDFSFGALAVGEEEEFSIFYGAAGTQTAANAAVSAVGAEIFSYGQPNGGQVTGAPNTFIWGFKAVGGTPVIPPTLTLTPAAATNRVGTPHTLTARLQDSSGNPVPGAPIVFQVSGANPQAPATRTTAANGRAAFTYTGTRAGGDTIRACLDNNENGACDPGEVTDTASKTWTTAGTPPPSGGPVWEAAHTDPASGCSAQVQSPYLDANQQVTAYTKVFCPRPTRLTVRSRLRSDHRFDRPLFRNITVAQRGCIRAPSCVVDQPAGTRFYKLTCPRSSSRTLNQNYFTDIIIYAGTSPPANSPFPQRSRPSTLSPFCAS